MRSFRLLPVCLLLVAPVCPQDSRSSSPDGPKISDGRYECTLPRGWRQLTPDEARTLRPKLPRDLRDPPWPGVVDRCGAVDKWLRGEFDGRCLTVGHKEGEHALDTEALAEIRSVVEGRSAEGGFTYSYVSGKQAAVGQANHPVLEVVTRIQPSDGTRPMQALEVYAPTGGNTVIFELRAYEGDFARALPQFRQVLGTLIFAREAKGPTNLSDRLQNAAIVGAIVGLVLLVLYKWSRS